jgi:hypothetical protein
LKLIKCDGRTLTVWEIGGRPLLELHAGRYPIKRNGYAIMSDDAARVLVRELQRAQSEGNRNG